MKKKTDDELPVVQFPKQFWFFRPPLWGCWRKWSRPITFGADEYGQHTLSIGIPGIIAIGFPYKMCGPGCPDYDDPEMGLQDLHCAFPGCPYLGMYSVPYEPTFCITHHESFWKEYVDERRAEITEGSSGTD